MNLYRLAGRVPATRPAVTATVTGATFGPWATHAPRCSCNVCK
jgi:hypothetical protein